ncbi:MAG: hypothetical protein WC455_24520 [Dehalococcoidia bacterium]
MQRELSALFGDLSQRIGGVLLAASGPDGLIPQEAQERTRIAAGRLVDEVFTREQPGRRGNHAYSFDGVTPLAPYPALLNRYLARAMREAVEPHTRYMQRVAPEDVKAMLTSRTRRIVEMEQPTLPGFDSLRLFRPNPLAQYESPHTWVDPNGYRLSDRVWRNDEETRRRLDQLMAKMMSEGRSAQDIAKAVERFLKPAERLRTTTKPYGEKYGTYANSAMRLARSEITRAAGWAQKMAALANPYVSMMDWVLSASHPRIDICDTLADDGPYPVEDSPIPVQSSHPFCLCHLRSLVTQSPADVTNRLREALMESERLNLAPYMTPLQIEDFMSGLLGDVLYRLASQLGRDAVAGVPF